MPRFATFNGGNCACDHDHGDIIQIVLFHTSIPR